MKALSTCFLVLVVTFSLSGANIAPPKFENPPENTTESGYIKLSWEWPSATADVAEYEFDLEQAQSEQFTNATSIYRGQDLATFLSGLPNGDYFYRVRVGYSDSWSDWSDLVMVRVEHHSLSLAFTLFGLGALVFLLTVGIVIQGNRKVAQNP